MTLITKRNDILLYYHAYISLRGRQGRAGAHPGFLFSYV